MKTLLLIATLLVAIASAGYAQEKTIFEISGRIVDKYTNKGLTAVHVININSRFGTITDTAGYYRIYATSSDTIRFSTIGYNIEMLPAIRMMNFGKVVRFALIPRIYELAEAKIWGMTWEGFRDSVYATVIDEEDWRDKRWIETLFTEAELQKINNIKPTGIPISYTSKDDLQRLKVKTLEDERQRKKQANERLDLQLIARMTGYTDKELLQFVESLNMKPDYLLSLSEYELIMALQIRHKAWEYHKKKRKNKTE